jgi:serine/threonine protein phosphatase 1
MDLTYVVADLHGSYDLLERALADLQANGDARGVGDRTAVFLGDYVDRGPQSREVIERLMAGPPPGWRWLCLKGNHEEIVLDAHDDQRAMPWWIGNGGGATLRSFHLDPEDGTAARLPPAHLAWMRALPPLAVDRHRVFVHAGINVALRLDEQVEHDLLWSRARNNLGHDGRFVVHGHTPHPHGPVTDGNSINLDTLAWSTGRLVVGVFDDARPGGPVELIEVLRA